MANKKGMSKTAAALSIAGAFAAAITGGVIANNNSHHTLAEDPTGIVAENTVNTETEYDAAINEALDENEDTLHEITSDKETSDKKDSSADKTSEEKPGKDKTKKKEDTPAAATADLYKDIDLEVVGKTFRFRNDKRLSEHYEKHGIEMGFDSKEDYAAAADKVIHDPESLHKLEAEDSDYVFYLEKTNEFVIVSDDGYIRTYFNPSDGIRYYNRQ
ncbi:MAG: hypothetical protein K6G22_08595 [Lachnospiraceae bacterium]|nr:hypothetical protein [Lachnospiraceae bacterium]